MNAHHRMAPNDRVKGIKKTAGLKFGDSSAGESMALVEFIPKEASEEMWSAYFVHSEALFRESNPRGRLPNRDAVKRLLSTPNPLYAKRMWMVIAKKDRIAAMGAISYDTELAPDYEVNRNICHFQISVDSDYRRKKIAAFLVHHLIGVAGLLGKTFIRADVDNDAGHEFCKRLRGQMIHREIQHRLYLEDLDWQLVEQWRARGRSRFPETKIESFQDCPEEDIEEFCSIYTEIINQRPVGDLKEKIVTTPESRRIEERNMHKRNIQWHTMISREQDGHISALTDILYNPQEPYRVHQYFTGVLSRYRRRGLAKRLKAEMLTYIVVLYPEAEYITTTTAKENEPMRAINKQLGFTPRKTYYMYRWPLEDLQRRVERVMAAADRRDFIRERS